MDIPTAYPNVAVCDDVIIVGEAHGYDESAELVSRVVGEQPPTAVAVELPPVGIVIDQNGGIGAALEHARGDIPAVAIDDSRPWIEQHFPENLLWADAIRVANAPQNAVEETGRMPLRAIQEVRNTIRDRFGQDVFDAIYIKREQRMADRLRTLTQAYDGTIVAVVGAFHVPAVSTFLGLPRQEITALSEKRIRTPSETSGFPTAATVQPVAKSSD